MKSIIYLDMDGVLADFEGKCVELVGPEWVKEINQPGWGALNQFPDLYSLLDPMSDALELYKGCVELIGDKNRVQCLTALPNRARDFFPNAAKHKIDWVHNHIDPSLRVHFGPFAKDKQYHVKHAHDVLIDDMYINIKQWRAAGGIGVEHKNAKDTLQQLSDWATRSNFGVK